MGEQNNYHHLTHSQISWQIIFCCKILHSLSLLRVSSHHDTTNVFGKSTRQTHAFPHPAHRARAWSLQGRRDFRIQMSNGVHLSNDAFFIICETLHSWLKPELLNPNLDVILAAIQTFTAKLQLAVPIMFKQKVVFFLCPRTHPLRHFMPPAKQTNQPQGAGLWLKIGKPLRRGPRPISCRMTTTAAKRSC